MTVEEYFRFDEQSDMRHEYVRGEVYAMTGGTVRHGTISMNIGTRLDSAAGDGPCRVFLGNLRVQVHRDIYYYPDVAVVCTPLDELDIVAHDPCVVVEVTSPGTARVDRSEKLEAYRQVDTLLAYLIVDHRRRRIERHWREAPGGVWQRTEIVAAGDVIIPCLDVELSLDEVYRRVELPAVGEPEPVEYEI